MITLIVLAVLTLFVAYKIATDMFFLQSIRYRYSGWRSGWTNYRFRVANIEDSLFDFGGFPVAERGGYITVSWSGDTTVHSIGWRDGWMTFDPHKHFHGYDSSIITLTDRLIIPKRVGTTTLIINLEKVPPDTIQLEVKQKNNRLVLRGDRVLEPVYRDSLREREH